MRDPQKKEEKKLKKKNRNPFVKVLLFILKLLLVLVLVFALWCAYSAIEKKKALSMIPLDYSVYVHTDSAWDALEPVLDLPAADLVLSDDAFVKFRSMFMEARSSSLRKNKLVSVLASRKVDASLYEGDASKNFVAVVDMGVFSAITRPAEFILPHFRIKNVSYVKGEALSYFIYENNDTLYYIKPYHNLVVISPNLDLFRTSLRANNDLLYSNDELDLLTKKTSEPIRIVVDAHSLAHSLVGDDQLLLQFADLIDSDTLSVVSLDISENEINMTAQVPFSVEDENPLMPVVSKNSTMPALLSRMSDIVQYYTLLNAGSLEELKNALFPFVPKEKDIDGLWKTAESLCKTFFSSSLEDLVFSWTGNEFAAMGVEGQNDAVFVIQVKDEAQRQYIFDKIISSIIIKNDSSLIIDGVRIPQLQLPSFIQNLLGVFNVNVPMPYYVELDGYLYLSQSAEAISSIYTTVTDGRRIAKNENWIAVSKTQSALSTVSLFYNLERSIPFFLRSNEMLSKILQLYSIGRCDIRIQDSMLTMQISASAKRSGDLRAIPGFPIALEGKTDGILLSEKTSKPEAVFWVEDSKTIHSLEVKSMQQHSAPLSDACTIAPADVGDKNGGVLWAVTEQGAVYLLSRELECLSPFPVLTGEQPVSQAAGYGSAVVFVSAGGDLISVDRTGAVSRIPLSSSGNIKSLPSVQDSNIALYDKSFVGKILLVQNGVENIINYPLTVPGIAFGSPAMIQKDGSLYVAFITQAGSIYVWKDGAEVSGFPKNLDGVFYLNVASSSSYFYALSSDARLYRISLDGSVLSVDIPLSTAREGSLTVLSPSDNANENVYVCADGNLIYGFTSDLVLIPGFPIVGWGQPAFADVNGDNIADCFALTINGNLNAWNLR